MIASAKAEIEQEAAKEKLALERKQAMRDLADTFVVMDRGAVVMAGDRASMVEEDVRRHMSV